MFIINFSLLFLKHYFMFIITEIFTFLIEASIL